MNEIRRYTEGKRVLMLEGYCKQCLPFLREFKSLGCEVSVLCNSKLDCCYVSRLPDHKILGTCDMHRPEESEAYMIELIRGGEYDIVFSPFDFSSRILSHNKSLLSNYAIIYANEKEVFDRANDKGEVMRVCMENGLPCPKTVFHLDSLDNLDSKLSFPIIIKPHSLFGARGIRIFYSLEEMRSTVEKEGIQLNEYVIQEYIPEGSLMLSGNIMVDQSGTIKSSYLYVSEHIFPERGGTSTLNGIIERPDILADCEKLVSLMGLRGEIGVDVILDARDNVGKIIEINPRPGHGITLGFISGINHAQQILEDALGLPVSAMSIKDSTTAVRISQTDVLWFLTSKDRFRRSPKRLGYRKVKEQMFYWDDPLPWFAFLLSGLLDFRTKMKEKKSN